MSTASTVSRLIRCPHCQKSTRYDSANPFRPFCSERCKNEDIVGWAEEKYHIPSEKPADDNTSSPHSEVSDEDEELEF